MGYGGAGEPQALLLVKNLVQSQVEALHCKMDGGRGHQSCFGVSLNIRPHVLINLELVTNGLLCNLSVSFALIPGILIVISHFGPAVCLRGLAAKRSSRLQVHVAEGNIRIAAEVLDDLVPSRRLFFSSASSFGGDEPYEQGFASVHVVSNGLIEVLRCKLSRKWR